MNDDLLNDAVASAGEDAAHSAEASGSPEASESEGLDNDGGSGHGGNDSNAH